MVSAEDRRGASVSSTRNPRKRLLFDKKPALNAKLAKKNPVIESPGLTFPQLETECIALACGQGDTGQLGLGESITERKRLQPIKVESKFVQAVCGGMHSVCLAKNGDVYTFGCNDESALGRKTDEEEENFIAGIVEIPNKTRVIQVSAGDSHSAALDDSGSVFIWGIFRDAQGTLGLSSNFMEHCYSPLKLEGNLPKIVKICSGYNHLVMLGSNKQVFSVGAAEQGELGRVSRYQSVKGGRRGVSSVLEPAMLFFQGRHEIKNIWAFGYNSFFLSEADELFSCGLNNYGQTGTAEPVNNIFRPTKVKNLHGRRIVEVCGGDHHTLFLDDEAHVHAVGRGDMGRLGIGHEPRDPEHLTEPQLLDLENIVHIGAGSCVSFAINRDGELFSWGASTNNQLGTGSEDDQLSPVCVVSKQLENRRVCQVSAGGQHTMCLVIDNHTLTQNASASSSL